MGDMEILLLIFSSFGIVMIILAIITIVWRIRRKKKCTAQTIGTVAGISSSSSGNISAPYQRPLVDFFVNGELFNFEPFIRTNLIILKQGQQVTVFYNPENPRDCLLKEYKPDVMIAWLLMSMGVIFTVITIIFLLPGVNW